MRVLLDTHILLWLLAKPEKLPATARQALEGAEAALFSPMNLWEIGVKSTLWPEHGIFKLDDIHAGALRANLRELPIRSIDTMVSTQLPPLHRDPIDRILMAQSVNNQTHLLTVDEKIAAYGLPFVIAC